MDKDKIEDHLKAIESYVTNLTNIHNLVMYTLEATRMINGIHNSVKDINKILDSEGLAKTKDDIVLLLTIINTKHEFAKLKTKDGWDPEPGEVRYIDYDSVSMDYPTYITSIDLRDIIEVQHVKRGKYGKPEGN